MGSKTRYQKQLFTLGSISFSLLFSLSSCGRPPSQSSIEVSDVAHTPVKRQSIGNCWLYATSTWAESLHLAATRKTVNLSESYWTYWDWYKKLVGSADTEISTGGHWWLASEIIREHGYMLEGDFLPNEANSEMSATQKRAEVEINKALKTGSLKSRESRTPENVIKALNAAFGVDIEALKEKIYPASRLKTGAWANGSAMTLKDEIYGGRHGWSPVSYPQLYGQESAENRLTKKQRAAVLTRVLRAVNDRKPVIMSTMVEFAALNIDHNATFEYDLYINKGQSEGQGGHLIVLEDYAVDNVPGVGRIGEGDVDPTLKEKALEGTVDYLVVKNSWGTNRPNRGLTDGYTRFDMKYLNSPMPFDLEEGETDISKGTWYSPLSNFVLPPEY